MTLPFFYFETVDASAKQIVLDEETSRHAVQVLRMNAGEKINLTDGEGNLITAEIKDAHKKHCGVSILAVRHEPQPARQIIIAVSLLKNTNRFEWFLEKATEIGITEIIPLICERTEKQKFRFDRMKGICISAMLQSQQVWLPRLHEPMKVDNALNLQLDNTQKFIAHCDDGNKYALSDLQNRTSSDALICIGPEGDFSKEEIELALKNDFIPVSLGQTRLRTETAGIVAATLLSHI